MMVLVVDFPRSEVLSLVEAISEFVGEMDRFEDQQRISRAWQGSSELCFGVLWQFNNKSVRIFIERYGEFVVLYMWIRSIGAS